MDETTFKVRTKKLALAIVKEVNKLPRALASDVIGKQLIRSGTSIEANYRAACRAKSTADTINKMKIVEAGLTSQNQTADIYKETNEILSMTVAAIKTLPNRKSNVLVF